MNPQYFGNWKIVRGDDVFVKVVGFPVPDGSSVCGESMWVKVIDGTDNAGSGILENEPAFCVVVQLGDLVYYGHGTDTQKPRYEGKVKS